MKLENVTDDLFRSIRKCYNQGTDSTRSKILEECCEFLLISSDNISDQDDLYEVYSRIEMTKKQHINEIVYPSN